MTWSLKPLSYTESIEGWRDKRRWKDLWGPPPTPKVKKDLIQQITQRAQDTHPAAWGLTSAWEMPRKREIQECDLKGVKWWGCCLRSSCGLRTFPEKTTFTSFLVQQLQLSQGPLPPSILPSSSRLSAGGSGGQLLSPCPWITACFSHILSTRRARTSGLGLAPVRSLAPCLDPSWPPAHLPFGLD